MKDQLQRLQDDIERVAVQFGMKQTIAGDFSRAMLDRMMKTMGGDYLPKVDKERRNKAIKMRFNGVNHTEICSEFGVSKATLYRVLGDK